MPREIDLTRERKIRELRNRGLGVRRIAREIGASPSTVSRRLRGIVDHKTLSELTDDVRALQKKTALLVQAIRFLMLAFPQGHPVRGQLADLLALLRSQPVADSVRLACVPPARRARGSLRRRGRA